MLGKAHTPKSKWVCVCMCVFVCNILERMCVDLYNELGISIFYYRFASANNNKQQEEFFWIHHKQKNSLSTIEILIL